MDQNILNVIFTVLASFVFGAAAILAYFQYSKDRNTDKIRIIVYSAIDAVFQLYDAKEDISKLIDSATKLTVQYIQQSDLGDADKKFWNEDKIRRFVTPVLTELYNNLNKNKSIKTTMLDLAKTPEK